MRSADASSGRPAPDRSSARREFRRTDLRIATPRGSAGLPMLFPDALQLDPRYYAYEVLKQMQPPFWVNGQMRITPTSLNWGNRITNTPPNMTVSRVPQHQLHQGRVDQPDQDRRPSHDQGRVLQQPQLQVAEPEQRAPRSAR